MSFRTQVTTITMAQSAQVTAAFNAQGVTYVAAFIPVLTAADLILQGGGTQDGDFHDVVRHDVASLWELGSEAGSRSVALGPDAQAFPYLRFRASVAQAEDRHFVFMGKRTQ